MRGSTAEAKVLMSPLSNLRNHRIHEDETGEVDPNQISNV